MLSEKDADYFQELQTQTGWGRTLASFADWCQARTGWRVLDVGCGPGLLPAIFARQGCRAVGVDLEKDMFVPHPVHPSVLLADAGCLPFTARQFDLVTASNLLFLLPTPERVLSEMRRITRTGGQVALLNPSEHLNLSAADALAEQRGLNGLARQSLLNWATRAEAHHRWNEAETIALFRSAGIDVVETQLRIGPGFARFTRGRV